MSAMLGARVRWVGLASLAIVVMAGLVAPIAPARAQVEVVNPSACDPIDPSNCLLPFPNDFYTVPDGRTDTGIKVALNIAAMPRNVEQKPMDPTEWNRNDGWSPGAMPMTFVPGLDLGVTGAAPITDIARSLDPDAPIQIINAETGEQHLMWAELNSNAETPADRVLIMRPGVNFEEGTRYIVALSNLKNAAGITIPAGNAFKVFRDNEPSTDPATNARRPKMESIFASLAASGVQRSTLYLAWDFTVASERSLSERMLHIRDRGFETLGDLPGRDCRTSPHPGSSSPPKKFRKSSLKCDPVSGAQGDSPDFAVDRVTNYASGRTARRVDGTFAVPSFLTVSGQCAPNESPQDPPITCSGATGSRLNYAGSKDGDGFPCTSMDVSCLPSRAADMVDMQANFTCSIPRSTISGSTVTPARPSLYGHGLLGGAGEVTAGNVQDMGKEHNFSFCATNWVGMATEDIPNIATMLHDMSNFPSLPDRAQQGMLNFLFLGRLMIHPEGFVTDPAFQMGSPLAPVLDRRELFYDGNSQGGIMGGALTAVSTDFKRAVLGVPGMNYSTLLNRSVDFEGVYSVPMYASYPSRADQQLIFSLIQMLWDRGEANGYAHHMTDDPYANTPPHKVLLHPALGDHQVANVTTEVEARTIGASVYQPALDPGRHSDVDPFNGIPSISSFPFDGSALVVWDSGTPTPPTTNTPPRAGSDPHSRPRAQASARRQKAAFLMIGGSVIDVCSGMPCKAP